MDTAISPELVLAARGGADTLFVEVKNDFFRTTWQASHVRFVELLPYIQDQLLPTVAAHVLASEHRPDYALEQWLPNVSFIPSSAEKITELTKHAVASIARADLGKSGEAVSLALKSLDPECDFVYEIEPIHPRATPSAPYHYGPTYMLLWARAGWFFYLQVHNES